MSGICFSKIFGTEDGEEKVCEGCLREPMLHAARKTKQQSVRPCGSLLHGPLIMQEVRGNSLLWAILSNGSLFDLGDESDAVYTY